jgi:3-oxoadipate enol-lactonase
VIFSHGIGSNHLHWWQQVVPLSKEFQVITFDHRGFGYSTDDGRGPPAFVDDLIGLADHLKLERTALMGQSMGGFSVAGFASRQPARITALALSSSAAGLVPNRPPPPERLKLIQAATNYAELAHVLIHSDGFPRRKPELCFLFEQLSQLNHGVRMDTAAKLGGVRHDPEPILDAGIPLFLLGGEEEHGVIEAMGEIVGLFPGTPLEIVPDTGHLLFFEHASAFNEHIGGFLRKTLL